MQWRKMNRLKAYLVIDFPVHDKHDGENFNSLAQSVGNLKWLL